MALAATVGSGESLSPGFSPDWRKKGLRPPHGTETIL